MRPLAEALTDLGEEFPVRIVTNVRKRLMDVRWATNGRSMNFAKATAPIKFEAWYRVMRLLARGCLVDFVLHAHSSPAARTVHLSA
jgi:hypothetical protein